MHMNLKQCSTQLSTQPHCNCKHLWVSPPPLPGSFRNLRGKKINMVLPFREDQSLGPPSPAPDFAVNIRGPQALHYVCHTMTEQTNPFTNHPPTPRCSEAGKSAAAKGWLLGS